MAQPTDAAIQAALRKAVRGADQAAGADDGAFLAELRARVKGPARARAGGGGRALGFGTPRKSKGAKLANDPRYLAGMRALAQRGATNARIVGGSAVRGTEFHDCVAVGTDADWGCTGTLIRPGVVLTAAHCEEYHTRVFIGNDVDGTGRVIRVARAIPHSRWEEVEFHGDLMLLILEKKVTTVKPRKLATRARIDAATDARIVGFGSSDTGGRRGYGVKRKTDVPIVSTACRGKVAGKSDGTVYGCHRGKELIAGKPFLLQDTCKGDSGGPLYVADASGRWLLAGVTSRGTELTQRICGDGGIYVRVDEYRTWIDAMIARYYFS